jgi:hypothetical protein
LAENTDLSKKNLLSKENVLWHRDQQCVVVCTWTVESRRGIKLGAIGPIGFKPGLIEAAWHDPIRVVVRY